MPRTYSALNAGVGGANNEPWAQLVQGQWRNMLLNRQFGAGRLDADRRWQLIQNQLGGNNAAIAELGRQFDLSRQDRGPERQDANARLASMLGLEDKRTQGNRDWQLALAEKQRGWGREDAASAEGRRAAEAQAAFGREKEKFGWGQDPEMQELNKRLARLKIVEAEKAAGRPSPGELAAPAAVERGITGYTGPKGEFVGGLDLTTPQGLRNFMASLAADRNIPKELVQLRAREEVQRRQPMPTAETLTQYPQLRKEAEAAQQRTEQVDWQQRDWTRRPWDAYAAGKQAFQERIQASYARLLMDLIARG